MSGARAQHLERRQGIYGLRVRVPDDIRPVVGMVEVRRSLRTYDAFRTRVQSAVCAARLFEVFRMVRENGSALTEAYVRQLIAASLKDAADALLGHTLLPSVRYEAPTPVTHGTGVTLVEAIDAYLEAKRRRWTAKTYKSNVQPLSYLRQHIGADTFIRAITTSEVRSFRDSVCRLRRSRGTAQQGSFAARQTENVEDRIDGKTAILTIP